MKTLLRLLFRYRYWKRSRRILHEQGFLVFCDCGRILNDCPGSPTIIFGIYVWQCPKCKDFKAFDLAAGPIPIPQRAAP